MKKLNALESNFWNNYLRLNPAAAGSEVEASFAGNEAITDALLALYLSGKKTAGSGLVEDYLTARDPLPVPGRHWIVLDSKKVPRCILLTERVERHKFCEVPEAIAIAEGEGDLSLSYWRECHERFFRPFLAGWGVAHIDQASVVTEFFRVVFPAQ